MTIYDPPMSIDGLGIRRRLGVADWSVPRRLGLDSWAYLHKRVRGSLIVSSCPPHDGVDWIHASIAWADHMPTYEDLKLLHRAVFEAGWAYQVFAPPSDHVNIHQFALHLFGRQDGAAALPDFTEGTGSI